MLYNRVGHLDASGNYVYTKNSDRIANEKRQYLSTDSEYTVEINARNAAGMKSDCPPGVGNTKTPQ